MIGFSVVGYGYWGPNLVRNLTELQDVHLVSVCDKRPERLAAVKARYPCVEIADDVQTVLTDPKVDAVCIATPVASHFNLAMAALMAGKHVFIEKPMTASLHEAQRLVELADTRGLTLAVDHTFIHTAAVRKMREIVEADLGQVYYYDSVRVNLGLFQSDVSVLWDLAVHDLSIMDYILPERPIAVSATGMSHVCGAPENIAYLSMFFPSDLIAHVHVNWLAPVKVRRTLVGGSSKMIVYDDLEPSEKIKIYDRGITLDAGRSEAAERNYQMRVGYRVGDMWAPHLEVTEALSAELAEFRRCIESGAAPTADGHAGARVVGVLEAASRSLALRGRVVELAGERCVA